MNQYITGAIIKELREKRNLTQVELADSLCVSSKTISKWETGKGYPDILLLESIAKVFNISISELINGNTVSNTNIAANMIRSKFYVCPICGNMIHSVGEVVIHCHGVQLMPCIEEKVDEKHYIYIEKIEDELYVKIEHDMSKQHYISFMAALGMENIQAIKLYPESNAEGRFKLRGVRKIIFYCNKDGMFSINV